MNQEIADLIARVYKLEQNFKLMQEFCASFIDSHNKLVVGCEHLEKKIDEHIGKTTLDDTPRIVVPSGEG